MERVEEKAYAKLNLTKLNLTLGVLYKRMDGYHALDTLMQTVSLHDRVTVAPAKTVEVHVTGATLPVENTMYRAAKLYQTRSGKGCLVTCEKRLPAEAGMGGGSADAAAVLRGLQRLHRMLTDKEIREIALQVGADVPFCLQGGLCRCEGVGEILTPVIGPTLWFAVVKPPRGVSTKALFQMFGEAGPKRPSRRGGLYGERPGSPRHRFGARDRRSKGRPAPKGGPGRLYDRQRLGGVRAV